MGAIETLAAIEPQNRTIPADTEQTAVRRVMQTMQLNPYYLFWRRTPTGERFNAMPHGDDVMTIEKAKGPSASSTFEKAVDLYAFDDPALITVIQQLKLHPEDLPEENDTPEHYTLGVFDAQCYLSGETIGRRDESEMYADIEKGFLFFLDASIATFMRNRELLGTHPLFSDLEDAMEYAQAVRTLLQDGDMKMDPAGKGAFTFQIPEPVQSVFGSEEIVIEGNNAYKARWQMLQNFKIHDTIHYLACIGTLFEYAHHQRLEDKKYYGNYVHVSESDDDGLSMNFQNLTHPVVRDPRISESIFNSEDDTHQLTFNLANELLARNVIAGDRLGSRTWTDEWSRESLAVFLTEAEVPNEQCIRILRSYDVAHFKPYREIILDASHRIWLITAPVRGGKSTLLEAITYGTESGMQGRLSHTGPGSSMSECDGVRHDFYLQHSVLNAESRTQKQLDFLKNVMRFATKKTLIIIDEILSGADPDGQVDLGRAMIEHFANLGLRVLFSTNSPYLNVSDIDGVGELCLSPGFHLQPGRIRESGAIQLAEEQSIDEEVLAIARREKSKRENAASSTQ